MPTVPSEPAVPAESSLYHSGARDLQDRFDTRRLADRLEERIVADTLDDEDKAFIESVDMFFLATVDAEGHSNCSYKGGDPGFVRVVDNRTIAFPNYDGNGMYLSMGNILVNPHVGLLFIDFENQTRFRFNGEATISLDDLLLAVYPEAQFIVRVRAREVFPNCPRYIHHYELVERSGFVPHANCPTPIPGWKQRDTFRDALPHNDPAR
jgi:predicted pyridoxine 5'-phosphate oxidase superfamily flavin-nucleotide-binding protein